MSFVLTCLDTFIFSNREYLVYIQNGQVLVEETPLAPSCATLGPSDRRGGAACSRKLFPGSG